MIPPDAFVEAVYKALPPPKAAGKHKK
jgi:hypothetical protein